MYIDSLEEYSEDTFAFVHGARDKNAECDCPWIIRILEFLPKLRNATKKVPDKASFQSTYTTQDPFRVRVAWMYCRHCSEDTTELNGYAEYFVSNHTCVLDMETFMGRAAMLECTDGVPPRQTNSFWYYRLFDTSTKEVRPLSQYFREDNGIWYLTPSSLPVMSPIEEVTHKTTSQNIETRFTEQTTVSKKRKRSWSPRPSPTVQITKKILGEIR